MARYSKGRGKGVPELGSRLNPPQTRQALSSATTRLNSRQASVDGALSNRIRAVSPSEQSSEEDAGDDGEQEEQEYEQEDEDQSWPPNPTPADDTDAGDGFTMLQPRILPGHLSWLL